MTAQARARVLLADALTLDITALPRDARIGAIEQWDSLAHLRLLLAIEAVLARELDPAEAARIECLDDVAALLDGRSDDAP